MDNNEIADQFALLAKLMDVHGENSFRSKNYSIAAFQLEKVEKPLAAMEFAEIAALRSIGESTAKKIVEIITTGKLAQLEKIIAATPPGVIEMLNIKGIGPKKINIIWKEMEVETVGELLYACNENRLTLYKGFGEKTQLNVKESIEFYLSKQGIFLYREVMHFVDAILQLVQSAFPQHQFYISGDYRMQAETIEELEFVSDINTEDIKSLLEKQTGIHFAAEETNLLTYRMEAGPNFKIWCCETNAIGTKLFETSGSANFLDGFKRKHSNATVLETSDEKEIFLNAGLPYIPAFLREAEKILDIALTTGIPELVQATDVKGIIHCHSKWSDGLHTLAQMAEAAIAGGFEYLAISDHSRSAGYANGLSIERILEQHAEIDSINNRFAPFKIFKSIESDILNDGSLDYPDEVLAMFDLVIASVHSNLKMSEDKATARLLKAIENPYTTILGHMTGRLFLSRAGYPVDHKKLIEACAANDVVIELNANSRRLDMDWRWIPYALEKGVLISINPDAHKVEKFSDVAFGVLAAQKGMLTADRNLSSSTIF